MGLAAVVATQLWHHMFIDGSLTDLPSWSGDRPTATVLSAAA
jgi:asparagine synthase (glutamine-hydrolysing)